jgi:hypothetical protein
MYSSTHSQPRRQKGVGGQHHAPAALPPGKIRYPLYRRQGVPLGSSGRVRKISPPPEFDPRTVQPVVSRYTDWATGPTFVVVSLWNTRQQIRVGSNMIYWCIPNLTPSVFQQFIAIIRGVLFTSEATQPIPVLWMYMELATTQILVE